MPEESRDEDLTLEGFQKFLDYVAPMARALGDNAPLSEELQLRYLAVALETDKYADQFLDEDRKRFMQTIAHSIAARHPDCFMEHSVPQWASAIESFVFVRSIDAIRPQSKRRAMLGACRYVAPGVNDLMEQIDGLLPQTPRLPDDPQIKAWVEAIAPPEARAAESAAGRAEDGEIGTAGAGTGRTAGPVDPGESAIPEEVREHYRRITHYTDLLGEFLGASDLTAFMRDLARLAVVYGSAESRAIAAEDVALFIEVMTLEILGGPPGENKPSEYVEIEAGLRRGNEELLGMLRVRVGRDAIVRGFEAEGYRPPPDTF
jgi:hypothetical protein